MGEDDELLSAAQKWSLQSSSVATSSSSDALLEQSSNCNTLQDVSLHHISSDIPVSSTSMTTPTTLANLDDSNNTSNSQTNTNSLVPSYINNPSVWAPLSTNDFIEDPSVIAAAMSGVSIENAVQYEVPKFAASPSITTSSKPPPSRSVKEEEMQSKKSLVATSKEFIPQKNKVVVTSSSPTAPSFDYSSIPMPLPPDPTPQYLTLNIKLPNIGQHRMRGDAAGIYQRAKTWHDGTTMYFKEGIWDGKPVTFVIFRTSLYQPTKKDWLLGIAGSIILFVDKTKRALGARMKWNKSSWKLFDTTECYNLIGKPYLMLTLYTLIIE